MEFWWEKELEDVLAVVRQMDCRVSELENLQLETLWLTSEIIRVEAKTKALEQEIRQLKIKSARMRRMRRINAIQQEIIRRLKLINRIGDGMRQWEEEDFEEERDGPTFDWLEDCIRVVRKSIKALKEDIKRV